jgi:hypothetical protein
LERPLERIVDKFPRKVLKTYRASKSAVWPHSSVDCSCIGTEPCLAGGLLAEDGQRDSASCALWAPGCRRRTIPIAIIEAGRKGIAEG